MEVDHLLAASKGVLALFLCFFLYISCLYTYRLFFHPLAKYPGPKLAALSNWYEFYYDVILQGKFTFHIQELHKKYGPIIRITPTELHIDEPEFYDTLYERAGRRDKYSYFSGRFGYASDLFSTIHHDVHRMRRKPLSPMFSAKRISEFQPVIRGKTEKFCQRLSEYEKDGRVIPLHLAMMALTTDIITEYAFARAYNNLDSPNFEDTLHEALTTIYVTGNFALHFPIIFPILDMLPDEFVIKVQPVLQPVVGLRRDLGRRVGEIRDEINEDHKVVSHPTIFYELLKSDLPDSEKTNARLGDEAQLIIAAGLITTSWALTVVSYHLSANPSVLSALQAELDSAGIKSAEDCDWNQLQKLPYLHGVVHECIRLGHGISTRSPRLNPDSEIIYSDWVIPKNTPVSMTAVDVLMNEKIFPEPRVFRPERWVGNPDLERFFVPFAKGSRQCLGINLAQAEMYIAIAGIFSRFEFQLYETDIEDVEMAHAYLLPSPKWESKGVRATVKLRKTN